MNLIELKNVAKYYKSEDNVSVGMKNISVAFNFNEFVAVTGASGSGKTTLLNVISGLDGYEEGEVYLNGEETSHYTITDWEKYRATYVGFVFQNYNIIDSFTVLQNVMLALDIQNYPRKERKKRALELIERVGLLSHKNHKASKLSGGQKQRAVIARALAKDCPIIVADEPTGNLDSESGKQVLALLKEISQDKLVILVTHNYSQAEEYATRRIKMHDGLIVEDQQIKPVEKLENVEIAKPAKMNILAIFRFAIKNLISQPKRFLFILLLQIVVVGALTFVYTQQIQQIREAGMLSSDVLNFVPPSRVLVQRRDGQEMSDDDYQYLNSFNDVNQVHKYGENFFSFQNRLFIKADYSERTVQFVDAASSLKPRFIQGRIAEAEDEIVISHNLYFNIGDQVQLSDYGGIRIEVLPNGDRVEVIDDSPIFRVVGIANDDKRTVYLSDAYLNKLSDHSTYIDLNFQNNLHNSILYDSEMVVEINDNKFDVRINSDFIDQSIFDESSNIYGLIYEGENSEDLVNITFAYYIYFYDGRYQEIQHFVEASFPIYLNETYEEDGNWQEIYTTADIKNKVDTIAYEELKELAVRDVIKTASLSVDGRASGNRLINKIDTDVYRVFYPANIKDPLRPVYVFLYTILAVLTLSLVGSFLYTILHAVTKNVMAARQKDFAIYRSIGASRTDLGKLVILEQVILSLTAFFFIILIFNILAYNVLSIATIIDYLIWTDYLILFIMFTLFGIMLGVRFNRKVFKQTVVETLSLAREDIL